MGVDAAITSRCRDPVQALPGRAIKRDPKAPLFERISVPGQRPDRAEGARCQPSSLAALGLSLFS